MGAVGDSELSNPGIRIYSQRVLKQLAANIEVTFYPTIPSTQTSLTTSSIITQRLNQCRSTQTSLPVIGFKNARLTVNED